MQPFGGKYVRFLWTTPHPPREAHTAPRSSLTRQDTSAKRVVKKVRGGKPRRLCRGCQFPHMPLRRAPRMTSDTQESAQSHTLWPPGSSQTAESRAAKRGTRQVPAPAPLAHLPARPPAAGQGRGSRGPDGEGGSRPPRTGSRCPAGCRERLAGLRSGPTLSPSQVARAAKRKPGEL